MAHICRFGKSNRLSVVKTDGFFQVDLGSYDGIMLGGDVLSEPPGVPILGESEIGATDYDWEHSKLREQLRNNRMSPGIEFDITEENRDGPLLLAGTAK
jgi:hypothetical protein